MVQQPTPEPTPATPDREFVREQYIQYHETRRQLNGFSWQIPSVAAVVLVLFLGLDPDKASQWLTKPLMPALGLLAVGLFMAVMLVNHVRNIAFLRNFEKILSDLEMEYGVVLPAYAKSLSKKFRWWQRLKSSTCLALYLLIAMLGTLSASFYFGICFFKSLNNVS